EQTIQASLQQKTTTEDITDRTDVQNGDVANIDYEGLKDGVAFEGGTAKAADLQIGSGQFIPGFEEKLIGAKVGETVNIDLTFPDPYQGNPDLAGKEVTFKVTVNSIKKTVTPELTDEFVKANSEAKTVAEYRKTIKQGLTDSKQQQADQGALQTIWQTVIGNATIITFPEGKIDKYISDATAYYTEAAASMEMEFKDLLKSQMGMTEDEFNTKLKDEATQVIKREVIVQAIAEAEKLTLSEKEYDEGIQKYMKNFGIETVEEMEKQYPKEQIESSLLSEKVSTFLLKHAKGVKPNKPENSGESASPSESQAK
ncbi:MAG: trigger factor, partial [Oscillospiraceae bacterium]